MQLGLMIAISLHVLPAVFWAGSSFVLARNGAGAERLFRSQIGSAVVAILAGGYLWHAVHEGSLGPVEKMLGAGAIAAVLAFICQVGLAGSAIARLRKPDADEAVLRLRIAWANRIAAVLLAIATIAMAASRYA
jgi:hypothetical protein